MKKKEYKIKIENGEIKPIEPWDLTNIKEGIIIFFEEEENSEEQDSTSKLLHHTGKWLGNDLEECLEDVYNSRGEADF